MPEVSAEVTNITQCGTISSGNYELNGSISGTGICLTINSDNVKIDCKGNSINYGSNGANGGIGINAILGTVFLSNITIKNCVIQDTNALGTTGYGILLTRVSESYIQNNSILTNGTATNHGIYMTISENNVIEDNMINAFGTTTGNFGVYLLYQANNNIIRRNNVTGTGTTTSYAVYLYGSDNNTLESNNLSTISTLSTGNTNGHVVYLYAGSKYNNIRDNHIYGAGQATNYHVYLYLNNNYNYITNNTIIAKGVQGSNVGVYILGSDFNEVQENNITTYGTTANYGISLGTSSSNNLIKGNSIITNGTTTNNYGISLSSALYNNITENEVFAKGGTTGNIGVILTSSQRNSISRNNISTSGTTTGYGIYLTGSDYDTLFENNITTYGTGASNNGVYLVSSTNNNVSHNSIFANGLSSGNIGVNLYTSSGYNFVFNNTIMTNGTTGSYGVLLQTANNNTVANNNISTSGTSTTNHGIFLSTSANQNKLLYNNITTYGTTTNHGISLTTASDSNRIIGNNILANGSTTAAATTTSNYGISLTTHCYNNFIENNTMTNDGGRYNYGISALVNSNNNLFRGNVVTTGGTGVINAGLYFSEARENTVENNVFSAFGVAGSAYGMEFISNAKRNLIKDNNISTTGSNSHGLYFSATAPNYPDNNTFQGNNFGSLGGSQLYVSTASINDIHLVDQNISTYYFTGIGSLVTVKNASYGEIKFLQPLTGTTQDNFSGRVFVRSNYAFFDSSVSGINKSAEITIYNISTTSTELQILRDGVVCPVDICQNLTSLQAGNVTFNVTGGGGYSISASSQNPSVELNFPVNGYNSTSNSLYLNFTANDDLSLSLSCNLYLNSSLNQTNSSVVPGVLTNFLLQSIAEGNYSWRVECYDDAGNLGTSESRDFSVSFSVPTITLDYPLNNSYLDNIDSVQLNYTVYDIGLNNLTVWLYENDSLLSIGYNVSNGTSLSYTLSGASLGAHNWSVITSNGLENSSNEYGYFTLTNLSLNCESGGPYQSGALVLVQGNSSDGLSPLSSQTINVSIYQDGVVEASKSLTSSNEGSFQTSFSDLLDGSYVLNVTASYQGNNESCTDSFSVGGSPSLVLDKIASFYNLTNETISYNITLKLTNKGSGAATLVNITDTDSIEGSYDIGTLEGGQTVQKSYLSQFTRNSTTYSYSLVVAQSQGTDSYLGSVIYSNSTQINLTIPSEESGQQLTLIKNAYFNSENSTAVNYTLTVEVINSGGLDLSDITLLDSDLGLNSLIDLNRTEGYSYQSSVIVDKAASNTEKLFVKSTATVNSVTYESNQINVQIPGYGGPADTIVYAPASVSSSTSFDSIVQIINQNPDIGQNFVLDYWITNDGETTNYTSGQVTVYVAASESLNNTVSLVSPSSPGTYRLRASVSYIGGPDFAYDSFEVVSSGDNSGGGSSGSGGSGGSSQNNESDDSENENGGNTITGNVVDEIVCNSPYMRYGESCCLDSNNNKLCDEHETGSSSSESEGSSYISDFMEIVGNTKAHFTGFLVSSRLVSKESSYFFALFGFLATITALVIYSRSISIKRKRNLNRLLSTRGMKVYAENGNHIGKVKDVCLKNKDPKIYGWIIVLDKKTAGKFGKREILLRHKHVKSLSEIMIVEEEVYNHLDKE